MQSGLKTTEPVIKSTFYNVGPAFALIRLDLSPLQRNVPGRQGCTGPLGPIMAIAANLYWFQCIGFRWVRTCTLRLTEHFTNN